MKEPESQNSNVGSQQLKSKSKFSWLMAIPVAAAVAVVGVLIVLSTFAATAGQEYVRDIYPGLLGRQAKTHEMQEWGSKIDSKQASKQAVFSAIYNSNEAKRYREKLIQAGSGKSSTTSSASPTGTSSSVTARAILNKKSNEKCIADAQITDAKGKAYWMAQLASGKTCAQVTDRIEAVRASKNNTGTRTTKDSNKNAPVSAAVCKKRLISQFDVKPWDTIDKNVETWLKDQYIHYQGYSSGYRPGQNTSGTGYAGWTLGDNGNALLSKIVTCEITAKQALESIKAEPGTKQYADEKQASFEQYELPVVKAMQNLLRQAIAASGKNYTCTYPSKKNPGKTVDMLNDPEYANSIPSRRCFKDMGIELPKDDLVQAYRNGVSIDQIVAAVQGGATGFCVAANDDGMGGTIGGTEDYASCSGGGSYYTAADVSQAQAENAATAESNNGQAGSSRPTYGAPSGTMNNYR